MTEQKTPPPPEQKSEGTPTPEDLALIPQALEDEGKDEAELWSEFEDAEKKPVAPAADTDSASPFKEDGAEDEGGKEDDEEKKASEGGGKDKDGNAAPPDKGAEPPPEKPDVWASAPPELKEQYDALKAEKQKLESSVRSNSGRVSALQRRINELQAAAQPSPKDKGRDEAMDPRKAIEGLAEEYPEIAQPLTKALEIITGRFDEIDQEKQERAVAARTELDEIITTETGKLETEHADWYDVLNKNGQAFAEWIEDQPRRLREAAVRNAESIVDGDAAIEIVAGFKKHLGLEAAGKPQDPPAAEPAPTPEDTKPTQPNSELNDRRKRQLAGTSSPPKTGGRPTVSGIPEDGDPEQIWDAFDAMERAQA